MSEPVNNLLSGYLQPDQRRRIANALMANQFDRPTPQDYPVQERAGVFPLATYANGQTGIAWPGFVAQPVESFNNLLGRGYQGGTGDTQGVEDAFNVAGAALVGGIASPKPASALGIFGGRLAKTADQAALARAEEMTARGVPREQVWTDTGWFKGVDGKWRFEIDDSGLILNAPVKRGGYIGDAKSTLGAGDIISHSKLLDAYPELAGMPVRVDFNKHIGSHFWPGNTPQDSAVVIADHRTYRPEWLNKSTMDANQVFMSTNGPFTFRSTAAHELQHAVQSIDGELPPSGLGTRVYMASPEVEARAVQKRMGMTPEQRRARPPWLDYDVPEVQQIVRFGK